MQLSAGFADYSAKLILRNRKNLDPAQRDGGIVVPRHVGMNRNSRIGWGQRRSFGQHALNSSDLSPYSRNRARMLSGPAK